MTAYRSPIRQTRDGRYEVRLDPEVRAVLRAAAEQVGDLVTTETGLTRRVYPPAYVAADQEQAESEYQKLVHGALERRHRGCLATLAETATSVTLDREELGQWLSAVETIRLVLGTRLDVSEDMDPPQEDDPSLPEFVLYDLLGLLQETIVDLFARELPEGGVDQVSPGGR
ncbi:MAG: DUF2017 family protein [Acidimicrobiales bacterium]